MVVVRAGATLLLAMALALAAQPAPVRLPLPSDLPALNSSRGIALLLAAQAVGQAVPFWQLLPAYTTQLNQAFCSVASSVMALNAAGVPAPVSATYAPYPYWTQDDVFVPCVVNQGITPEMVSQHGLTLAQAAGLLGCFSANLAVNLTYASEATPADLLAALRGVTQAPNRFLLANFERQPLGEEGHGHFSPVAAFDPDSTEALVMDVARYKVRGGQTNALSLSLTFSLSCTFSRTLSLCGWAVPAVLGLRDRAVPGHGHN
jgi:hypothetical protein